MVLKSTYELVIYSKFVITFVLKGEKLFMEE